MLEGKASELIGLDHSTLQYIEHIAILGTGLGLIWFGSKCMRLSGLLSGIMISNGVVNTFLILGNALLGLSLDNKEKKMYIASIYILINMLSFVKGASRKIIISLYCATIISFFMLMFGRSIESDSVFVACKYTIIAILTATIYHILHKHEKIGAALFTPLIGSSLIVIACSIRHELVFFKALTLYNYDLNISTIPLTHDFIVDFLLITKLTFLGTAFQLVTQLDVEENESQEPKFTLYDKISEKV